MDADQLDKLAGLGVLLHEAWLRPAVLEKSAGYVPSEALMAALLSARGQVAESDENDDAVLTSDISGSMSEDVEGDQGASPDSGGTEAFDKGDGIDGVMDDPSKLQM